MSDAEAMHILATRSGTDQTGRHQALAAPMALWDKQNRPHRTVSPATMRHRIEPETHYEPEIDIGR